MKVKVQHILDSQIEEIDIQPLYICKHVDDSKLYSSLQDVQFDDTSEFILYENSECAYGFSTLWLKDRKNKIYEYCGFGHSGAASVICSLLQYYKKTKDKK